MRAQAVKSIGVLLVVASALLAQEPRTIRVATDADPVIERMREMDAAIERKDWRFVAAAAQELIDDLPQAASATDEKEPRFDVVVHFVPDPKEPNMFASAREYATRRLASLPEEGRAEYRRLRKDVADRLLETALRENDEAALLDLGERFRVTKAGQAALLRLGHLALERGELALAARHFEDLLAVAWNRETTLVPSLSAIFGLALAYQGLGEDRLLAAHSARLAQLDEDRIQLAGRTTRLDDAWPRIERNSAASELDGARTLKVDWSSDEDLPHGRSVSTVMHPTVAGGRVVYHSRSRARALNVETGETLWTRNFDGRRRGGHAGLPRFQDRTLRSLKGARGEGMYAFVIEATDGTRHLAVLDDGNGETIFIQTLRLPASAAKATPLRLDAAPVIDRGRVWVTATDDAANPFTYVAAFDARTGHVETVIRLESGSPLPFTERNGAAMLPEAWLGASPMAYSRGLLNVCGNLGSFAVVDTATGRPRYLHRYARRAVESISRFSEPAVVRGFDGSPVLVDGDLAAYAPDDADHWYMMFQRPPAAARYRERNENWMLAERGARDGFTGIVDFENGAVVLGGRDVIAEEWGLVCLTPQDPKRLFRWLAPLDTPLLGAAAAGLRLYAASERYIYRVDRSNGEISNPLVRFEIIGAQKLGPMAAVSGRLLVGSRSGILCLVKAGD